MDEFWAPLRDYAQTVFTNSLYKCECILFDTEPVFAIREIWSGQHLMYFGNRNLHEYSDRAIGEEQRTCLKVCSFAIEHRHAFIEQDMEGIETFEKYLHYCIHEVTGAGFVKSGYKK